jgi:gluconolactonase
MLASTKTVTLAPRPHDPFTTNICFGGANRRSAFVTLSASGRLARLQWHKPGLALHFS